MIRNSAVAAAISAFVVLSALPSLAQVVVLGASQDVNIEASQGNTNLETTVPQYIMVNWGGGTDSRGLIQFDVSSVPTGSTVSSATMRLFQEFNGQAAGTTIDVFRNTSSWNENTVTFNTRPTVAAGAVSSLNIGDLTDHVFRTWDVTSVVQSWVNGSNPNFGLTLVKNPNQAAWPYLKSKEEPDASLRPVLTINLRSAAVPEPSSVAFLVSGGLGFLVVRLYKRRVR